ncbi:hypothetical protein GDO81_004608 [Engystomops pustulosus]|uniref:Dual specificity protein phosphatase n=1 Tax=Engystomops pustulosus TaxID=76066 RepID=A0AAV6ZYH2_ENGPU|nr:hypothetical protein GDO81_004608 [Engystomops pustulosus]
MAANTEKSSSLSEADEASADACPTVSQLRSLLDNRQTSSTNRVDEVWPNLYLGDLNTANNRYELWKLGITHVLNAAHGRRYSEDNPDFYGTSITYHAKVLVHCVVGISRSASLVLAYLMIHHQLSVVQAICTVQKNRRISPNAGFLRQLLSLDEELRQTRQNHSRPEMRNHGEERRSEQKET